ncbi:MAG TPA: hypothetical protein VE081_09220 [Sporichthyaceae bacterium]|nr:hypothetical protein [Sporichthyaceae bacterium]
MSNTRRAVRVLAGGGALGLAGALTLGWGPAARAEAPNSLATFVATSYATPYGIVSRVPVETAGGFLYSKSSVQLGKSLSQAAGFTLGDLGDTFVVTSAPPNTITAMPSVINAQDPPSTTAPREAHLTAGQYGGPDSGEVRNADLAARASDAPMATAQAAGNAVSSVPFSSGASSSRSDSVVAPDGTVTTKAITSVQNVVIGSGPTALTIAMVDSVASVTIPPGGKPIPTLAVHTYGAQLAGVSVTIDAKGISINNQVAVPPDALSAFKAGLDQLAAQGLTFAPSPMQTTTSDGGATVSGSVFSFRYHYPDAFPRPSDIGTDEEWRLGSVYASATARPRTEPPVAAPLAGAPAAAAPAATAPDIGAPVSAPSPAGLPPATVGAVPTVPFTTAAGEEPLFALPARVASPLPGEFRDGYRYVLLAAVAGIGTVLFVLKRAL